MIELFTKTATSFEIRKVTSFKSNQSTNFMYQTRFKKDKRKQQVIANWSMELVSNRFRLFLGRWSLEDSLYQKNRDILRSSGKNAWATRIIRGKVL